MEHKIKKAIDCLGKWVLLVGTPNVITFGTLITGLCRTANVTFALQYLEEMVNGNGEFGVTYKTDKNFGKQLTSDSRYETEFSTKTQLGMDGYGRVVKAMNMLYKKIYAIKTIEFNDDNSEKVLREAWVEKKDDVKQDFKGTNIKDSLEGIRHMHETSVVHWDLSTTNILLDDSDNVKISAFGLARIFYRGIPHGTSSDMSEVSRPPEDFDNAVKVDIYGLGSSY
ncbi:cysteine-rich receptor-like protein kinase 10 [Pistacia vera]|uniref:cysteine-rich receptor-like protein kinase 10 n=1 Tax=Pistacia vera TaxID=55513 RepID=UPI001263DC96|nr:cysteine-rich receptor-like protein kinase 10 [Pistacia vera]